MYAGREGGKGLTSNQWTEDTGWTVGLAENGEVIRSLPHTATKEKKKIPGGWKGF